MSDWPYKSEVLTVFITCVQRYGTAITRKRKGLINATVEGC